MIAVAKNVSRYKKQLEILGFDYDWNREINTTDPKYYRWTQWIFLKLWEKGLAYEAEVPINWCPSCLTGLANEEVKDGLCDRCGTAVTRRNHDAQLLELGPAARAAHGAGCPLCIGRMLAVPEPVEDLTAGPPLSSGAPGMAGPSRPLNLTGRIRLLDDFLEVELISNPERVAGLVPGEGFCLVLGAEKTGKSLLGAQLALSVAAGIPFLGCTTSQCASLLVEEDGLGRGRAQIDANHTLHGSLPALMTGRATRRGSGSRGGSGAPPRLRCASMTCRKLCTRFSMFALPK